MSDIKVTVRTESGQSHTISTPQDISAREFINEVLAALELRSVDAKGNPIVWILGDKDLGRTIKPDVSLRENGVRNGHVLFLSVHETFSLVIHIPNKESVTESVSPQTKLGDFIKGLAAKFDLGSATAWRVYDKDLGKSLSLDKSLSENGILGGHHLVLEKTFRWKIVVLSGAGALGLLILLLFIHGGSAPPSEPKPQPAMNEAGRTATPLESIPSNPRPAPEPPRAASVEVRPASANLEISGEITFTANVQGTDSKEVKWSLSPTVGRIQDGRYVAPPSIGVEQVVTVTATSVADPVKTGSASISLKPVHVTVAPATVELKPSETITFAATVSGSSKKEVQWQLTGPGQIAQSGAYTAPSSGTSAGITVRAMSKADPTKFAIATVVVRSNATTPSTTNSSAGTKPTDKAAVPASANPPSVPGSPPNRGAPSSAGSGGNKVTGASFTLDVTTVTLGPSQRRKVTAFSNGIQDSSVEWLLKGSGKIAQDGTYTSPSPIQREETVTVTAVSKADNTRTAVATILLKPISVRIFPETANLQADGRMQFQASVANGTNQDVKWSASGGGDISKEGLYTAPPSIASDIVAQVVAASREDGTRNATATVRLQAYTGKRTGTLTWSGSLPKNVTVTIEGGNASVGALTGDPLPGIPVRIELDNVKDLEVLESPDSSNGWKRLVIRRKNANNAGSTAKITWKLR